MNISEVIEELKKIKEKEGDIPVYVFTKRPPIFLNTYTGYEVLDDFFKVQDEEDSYPKRLTLV